MAGGTIDVKNSPGYMKDFVVINAVQITSVSGTAFGSTVVRPVDRSTRGGKDWKRLEDLAAGLRQFLGVK